MQAPHKLRLGFYVFSAMALMGFASLAEAAPPANGPACTVILEAVSGKTLHREGACDQRFTPNSTFKFTLALIGYDAGILTDEHTPLWDYRPEFNASQRDRKAVDPTIWEKESVLWFSREITRRLGQKRFAHYVSRFNYGNMDVSGDIGKNNSLTRSWVMSSLRISADEQANFLRRFLARTLPVSDKAHAMTRAVIPVFDAADGWVVHGKTGSGWLRDEAGAIDRNRPQGWFIGWAEKDGRQIVFARLDTGKDRSDSPKGLKARDAFLQDLPKLLKRE